MQLTCANPIDLNRGRQILQADLDPGIRPPERSDREWSEVDGGEPKPEGEPTLFTAREAMGPTCELVSRCDQLTCLGQQHGTELGECGAMPATGEQTEARFAFQGLDAFGQCGLGDRQAVRGWAEASMVGHCDEGP
ncbi:hypothetical protein Van01_51330 [Micromonospora andamanensis]|uniref:Uncharacterized protein n=1 Tax=Micromonospora andamanensis TaxID=1287068 RepID=A0ABQ4I1Z5_9ACTN|nr:hypothetical protein [Micromonospora andamanensis]GIJ11919.1 hypothetical protein Van01_51330 [Micromonospora andamanensis]